MQDSKNDNDWKKSDVEVWRREIREVARCSIFGIMFLQDGSGGAP